MADMLPPGWFDVAKKMTVIEFLRWLGIPAEDKKEAFRLWAELVGYAVTAEDIEAVTGLKAGEV